MGVIPFELQQFGFEFGTIYETINDILYIFFWGVTSMKRCHLPFFFAEKEKYAVQQSSEWSGGVLW